MLNKELEAALNKQVNLEIWSGYLYLSMSYDMNHKGFAGVAKWFMNQFEEELKHSQRIADHILAMNGKVELLPIAEVQKEWNSPKDAFENTLMHEKQVTLLINKLYEKALSLKCYSSISLLQWFIDEQIEEEATPRSILTEIKRIENDQAAMSILDQKLGS